LAIRGPFRGATGYDHHVRRFTREIVSHRVAVQLVDLPGWSRRQLGRGQRDKWFDTLSRPVNAEIMLNFAMPHQAQPAPGKRNINFTMFEATRIPRDWVQHNLKHDRVILPTASSRQAWIDSGYPAERIALCPLGVDAETHRPEVEPMPLTDTQGRPLAEYRTRVLNISELTPRKNLISLLRVWIENTSRSDDAILILKLNCPWRRWMLKFFLDVRLMEHRLGKSRKQAAAILFLINRRFGPDEMPRLYTTATHYWSMSHGEGWDLCMMEAGTCGLHLIATKHSAYTTYLDSSVADMIPSRLVPAKFRWAHGMQKYFRGARWWLPDETAAGDCIARAMAENSTTKGPAARARLAKDYTWSKAATRLLDILSEWPDRS